MSFILRGREPRARRIGVGCALGLIVTLGSVFSLTGVGRAATVALANTHLAVQSGADQPVATAFPSGTRTMYFDYSVITPSDSDTGTVDVYAGGTTGTPLVVSPNLIFFVQGDHYATLSAPGGGMYPDGGYCAVLYIDGVPESVNGSMPIPFTVGNASPPSCPLPSGATSSPTATTTTAPSATTTTAPTATATTQPTATSTMAPTATGTSLPAATSTVSPTATVTSSSSPTVTVSPSPTSIGPPPPPAPGATATATLSATATSTATVASAATGTVTATGTSTTAPTLTATPSTVPTVSPTATARPHKARAALSFVVHVARRLVATEPSSIRITVRGSKHHHRLAGVKVLLKAKHVGIKRFLHAKTNKRGVATFKVLWPRHAGKLYVDLAKRGFHRRQLTLRVQSAP